MGANSFGELLKVHTFGESHGEAYGVVIDGCPAGVEFDEELIQVSLNQRRPGQSDITTARQEPDKLELLSGVFEGKTLGSPLAVLVRNKNQRSQDYKGLAPRRGHADSAYKSKYGHSDPRGGGRSSGRETICRVIAGAVAQMICKAIQPKMKVFSYTSQVGELRLGRLPSPGQLNIIQKFKTRCPDPELDEKISSLLLAAKSQGESYGGVVSTIIESVPEGLGAPVFNKMKADLSAAMMSIGATHGVDFGGGFDSIMIPGTVFHSETNNYYGGLNGGITSGEPVEFRVGFKPTSSILDVAKKGRHDPCIVPRAVPVVEAMTWFVLADHLLLNRICKI